MATFDRNNIRLLSVSSVLILIVTYWALHFLLDVTESVALADSVITAAMFFIATLTLSQAIKLYPTKAGLIIYSIVVAMFFGEAHVYLSNTILRWWLEGEADSYIGLSYNGEVAKYIIYWLAFSWIATHFAFTKNISVERKSFKEQSDATTLHKEAELFKLRQQLQPHFLYNSLNSISALTAVDADKAQEMIGHLSEFLRNSVKKENDDKVPLKDELSYLDKYLAIEAIRFGDRLIVNTNKQDGIEAVIPPFLLQPILENAIKFGVYGNTGKITITLNISLSNEILNISITNPYDNDAKPPKGTGFGLTGVQRRLFLLYGRNDLLHTQKDEYIFTTTLKIPQNAQSNIDR